VPSSLRGGQPQPPRALRAKFCSRVGQPGKRKKAALALRSAPACPIVSMDPFQPPPAEAPAPPDTTAYGLNELGPADAPLTGERIAIGPRTSPPLHQRWPGWCGQQMCARESLPTPAPGRTRPCRAAGGRGACALSVRAGARRLADDLRAPALSALFA
jgi:hypothetical protein